MASDEKLEVAIKTLDKNVQSCEILQKGEMNFNDTEKKFVKLACYLAHGDFTMIGNVFEDFPHLKYNDSISDNISDDEMIEMIKGLAGCLGCKNTQ